MTKIITSIITLMFVMVLSTSVQYSTTNAYAISVTPTSLDTDIKSALLAGGGSGIDPSSVVVTISAPSGAVGTYVNPSATYGTGDGIVISSGSVASYNDGPNTDTGFTTSFGTLETVSQKALLDPITGVFTHYDVAQIDVTFDMLPSYDTVYFNTVFGSEEYDEFVGSVFIDGFGLYVNGVNIASVNTSPVNINHPDMAFVAGTELDGILGGSSGDFGPYVHTFSAPVNPTGNTLTFIVADSSDSVLDTTTYISALGGSLPPPIEICGDEIDNDGDGLVDEDCPVTNLPPDCSSASPQTMWPPNHQMRTINVQGVTDPDGDPLTYVINSIFQDEPTKSKDKGDKYPDAKINGASVDLRSERFGNNNGRVYEIGFTANDGQGGSCTGTFTVQVPHDQRGTSAINSGTIYNSLLP